MQLHVSAFQLKASDWVFWLKEEKAASSCRPQERVIFPSCCKAECCLVPHREHLPDGLHCSLHHFCGHRAESCGGDTAEDWSLRETAELQHRLLCGDPLAWRDGVHPKRQLSSGRHTWDPPGGIHLELMQHFLRCSQCHTVFSGWARRSCCRHPCATGNQTVSSRTSSSLVKVKGNWGGGCRGGGRWERHGHHFLVPGKGFTKAVFYFFNTDVGGEEGLEKEAWG